MPETPVAVQPEPAAKPEPKKAPTPKDPYSWGTGRRKTSVARVRVRSGSGRFMVNDRDVDEFFRIEKDRQIVRTPLVVTDAAKSYDVFVNVRGGGISGQSGAVALGLARALVAVNPDYEAALRGKQLLTRDPRKVERKKYGRSGARRRFQFSKR
jgi:small subunit ribosomal protein S9